MTERRGDPGFSVAPRRIGDDPAGPGRRRTRRLAIVAVVGAAIAVTGVALLGPRVAEMPHLDLSYFATPTPGPTESAAASAGASADSSSGPAGSPGITPLPEVTRVEGAEPHGSVAIIADGLRVLDLGSGRLEKAADIQFGIDAIVRAPDGQGWTCVCFADDIADAGPIRVVRVTAISPTGAGVDSFDVLRLPASFNDGVSGADPALDVDIRDGGRSGLLAIADQVDDSWTVDVAPIDLDRRSAGARVRLGTITPDARGGGPAASPAPSAAATPEGFSGQFLDGPHIRLSPDGRVAFVWGVLQTNSVDAVVRTAVHAWRLALDPDGSVRDVRSVDGLDGLPAFCSSVAFAAADRLAWFCPEVSFDPSAASDGGWVLGTVDLDGRAAGSRQVAASQDGFLGEALIDSANGRLYTWDPMTLVLTRFDVHDLTAETISIDPAARQAPGIAPGGGSASPVWNGVDSAVDQYRFGFAAASPDGSRLYLLGFEPITATDAANPGSLGIFVLDRSTLALLDRWAPDADYIAISVASTGLILATGAPGSDAHGHPAPWQGSLTVHDPLDGRILVRYGQLGQDTAPLVVDH